HDGQFEGRRVHVPVFLARAPDEPADEELRAFYERLVRAVALSALRDGDWTLCSCEGWPDNDSYLQLVSWGWSTPDSRHLVVVNLSTAAARARVGVPGTEVAGRTWELEDRLGGQRFERSGDDLGAEGLYVALEPWAYHFLAFSDSAAATAPRPADAVAA